MDDHKTPNLIGSIYSGMVSKKSVRITFTYVALNKLNLCASDIRNAYLQAPSSQKDYIVCWLEFGLENVGRVALIHREIYGGKVADRDYSNHLRSFMKFSNFCPSPVDPDVWMQPAMKANGTSYYEYILLYLCYALAISERA